MSRLDEYFKLPDAPTKDSPVGKLMVKILAEFPNQDDLEQVRIEAREALLGVGGPGRIQTAYAKWIAKKRPRSSPIVPETAGNDA